MAFGLLTALRVEDIPNILRRCARGWRGGSYARYPQTWAMAADEVERFAAELEQKIAEAKKVEPVPKRKRAVL